MYQQQDAHTTLNNFFLKFVSMIKGSQVITKLNSFKLSDWYWEHGGLLPTFFKVHPPTFCLSVLKWGFMYLGWLLTCYGAGLELLFPCLHLLSAGITGICHHLTFFFFFFLWDKILLSCLSIGVGHHTLLSNFCLVQYFFEHELY